MKRSLGILRHSRKASIITAIVVFGIVAVMAGIVDAQQQAQWQGRVVAITDGDTVKVLTDTNDEVKIRIYGIDAPEKKQKYGPQSKQALSNLVYNKTVLVTPISIDIYGRLIAKVTSENIDIGSSMVCSGNAWWYCEYARRDSELARCQRHAKMMKSGLWSEENPIPPWEFRKAKKH